MLAPIYIFGVTKIDGMLSHLEELLEAKNVFVRNRKQRRTRVLGMLMYHYGFSLRKCRTIDTLEIFPKKVAWASVPLPYSFTT